MVDVHNGTTRGIQGKKAKCVYNYKATMTDELNIKIDDIIVLTQCSEDETWLEGTLNGLTGWFPSNYVQILDEQQDVKRHENEDEILRNKYINELKQLEESFLDEMCKFIKIAIQPLKQNQIFSDLFVQNLICSLNDLIKFHQIFNQNLKETIENSKIGNYLISVAPQFKKVYESYAKNNPKFTIEINNKKEELSKFFESTLAKMSSPLLPTTSTITVAIYFTKFLAAPFKQLEIYVKVLKEIQRYTQVNSYCIYNSSPNQIRIRHLVSASFWQSFGGVHWRMETKNINSGDKYCCNWSNPLCFSDYAVAPNSQSRSTYRIVDVACSKYGESRDEFTQVRFPRGGYLDIKQSVFDNKNNWIEVHGHLNEDLGYWYRCGYTWQHND